MSSPTTLLVTVGSTLFTALTNEVLSNSVLSALIGLGFERLIVQYGAADLVLSGIKGLDLNAKGTGEFTWRNHDGSGKIVVQVMRYTDDFNGLVASADAVISHAGSGSILTVLRSTPAKPLLVVPNTGLMDNHQAELAVALEKEGHLTVSTVAQLSEALAPWVKAGPLKPFPQVKADRFRSIMDEMMGFDP